MRRAIVLALSLGPLGSALGATSGDGMPEAYGKMKNPLKPTAEVMSRARKLYSAHCVGCHGMEGKGDGAEARARKLPAANFATARFAKHSDQWLMWRISEGVPNTHMEAYKAYTDEKDRWSLILLLRTFRPKKGKAKG